MPVKCEMCGAVLDNKAELKPHVEKYHKKTAIRDLRLLEQGYVPSESKIGAEFKGKNKIIIAKD